MRASERWRADKSREWLAGQPWLMGFNFVPSTAVNTTEMWQAETFDPATIRRELGWAKDIGFNSTRVFLQYLVWKRDPQGLLERFRIFLDAAHGLGLSVVPVLFDDCAFGEPKQLDPFSGPQKEPTPGMILSSWTPSPGRRLGTDPAEKPLLRTYVQDILRTFSPHPAVLFWDLFNEPLGPAQVGEASFLIELFSWARQAAPSQPLTVGGFADNSSLHPVLHENSDLLTFHSYEPLEGLKKIAAGLKAKGYPVICTEWMARPYGSRFDTDLPFFREENIGCYQWGLVNGRTQCQFPWSNKPGDPIPEGGWFHDLLHPDGTPYRVEEVETIRRLAPAPQNA